MLRGCAGSGKLAGVMHRYARRATGGPMSSTSEAAGHPAAPGSRTLRGLLERTDTFLHLVEMVTSRGLLTDRGGKRVLALARKLVDHKDIHALSITDNPGGNAMFGADALGTDLISRGQEVVIHLSCKDWNRNALESRGWQLASLGFNNILALSGDFPVSGYQGQASPVFDTDSVGLLRMFSDMNAGIRAGRRTLSPTRFFLGAVVNNHKRHEREVMPQYFKLAKKIAHGARFIISQIGWDARKQDELLRYMAGHQLDVPVIANVYALSGAAARFFASGKIPGVVVLPELLQLAEKQAASPDKGKAFFLELAAKQVAVARGLGYRGAYLGGLTRYADIERVLEIAAGFGADDWRQFAGEVHFRYPDEFYYFEPGELPGTSSSEVSRSYLASRKPDAQQRLQQRVPVGYKLSRRIHDTIFTPETPGFEAGRKLANAVEQSGTRGRRLFHKFEHAAKSAVYDCRDCGDCSLPDIAYLCPESQCVKNQRNGPCGGTREGTCEIGDKECIWARAYDRLKAYGEEQTMLDGPAIIKNAALAGTSAWVNTYLGRDHFRHRPASQAGGTTEEHETK